MKSFTQKDIKALFSGLCCSHCKNDFTKNSIKILEKEGNILICNLICEKCGKDFGEVVFNFNRAAEKHSPLRVLEGPPPVSFDDVIDAHRYIKKHL